MGDSMFDFIRSHQRLMQFLLLVLIVPSFALIGVSGYSSYVSGDHDLVMVGKSAITMQEYDRARSNQLRQMQEMSPGGFDPAVLDDPMVRSSLLESLIDYRVLATTAATQRFSVSDTALRQSIASMPQLQVNGQFSPERYNDALASVGMTTRDFEQSQRFELALSRVLGPVAQSTHIPSAVIHQVEKALTEERTVRLHAYTADSFMDEISVSDTDIQTWYDEHKQEFEIPDQVAVQYLLLDEAAAMANLPEISDQELQDYYEQNRARYTQIGRVNASHIQINVPSGATQEQRDQAQAQASALVETLSADPASFSDLAKEHSQDAGTARAGGALGWLTPGTLPPALDQAVFALKEGEISDVIQGPGGYHVFLAHEVQPEQVQPFDELRDTLYNEVRRQLGAERFADMATRLTALVYDHPDSLEPAAQALSVGLRSASGVARDGLLSAEEAGESAAAVSQDASILADPSVRRALFSPRVLNERQNSGIIEISPDTMLVVRAQDFTPAYIPELDSVKDRIEDRLIAQRAHEHAVKQGQADLAALNQGEGDDTSVSDEDFNETITVSRVNSQGVEKSVLDAALAVDADSVPTYIGAENSRGFVIVHVENVAEAPSGTGVLATLPQELEQLWGQAEEDAVLKAMRIQTNVEFLPEAYELINTGDNVD